MNTPTGLEGNALALWTDTTGQYEFQTHELITLEHMCREVMLIERMQRDIDALSDLMNEGSIGQRVEHDLVKEIRQHEAKYEASRKSLNLPSEGEAPSTRATQAREAAKERWRRAG